MHGAEQAFFRRFLTTFYKIKLRKKNFYLCKKEAVPHGRWKIATQVSQAFYIFSLKWCYASLREKSSCTAIEGRGRFQ